VAFSGASRCCTLTSTNLIRHIRNHGMMAGLITQRYFLRAQADRRAERRRPRLPADQHRQRSSRTKSRKRACAVLDRSCSTCRDLRDLRVNINSVIGAASERRRRADDQSCARGALGFSTSVGIIHDGSDC